MSRHSAAMVAAAGLIALFAGCAPSERAVFYRNRDHPVPAAAGDGTILAYEPEEMFDALARRRQAEPVAVTAAGD